MKGLSLTGICGLKHKDIRKILAWFACQDEATQILIIQEKNRHLATLQDASHEQAQAELASLLQAIKTGGFDDEQAYRRSKGLSVEAAKRISARRIARAGNYIAHKERVRRWLAKNLGKIAEYRRAGLSWRGVALAIYNEENINIHYSTLHQYWSKALCNENEKKLL